MPTGVVQFPSVVVKFASNTLINVPVILQFEDTPLLEVVRSIHGQPDDKIALFASDGGKLGYMQGERLFLTSDGEKVGAKIDHKADAKVLRIDGKERYVLRKPRPFEMHPKFELYTPTGILVAGEPDMIPGLTSPGSSEPLSLQGAIFEGNTLSGCQIGFWFDRQGSIAFGCSSPPNLREMNMKQ